MVDLATVAKLVAGVVLLLGNGYFVTIEFAMTRIRQFAEEEFQGSRGLRKAWEMTEELEIYLSGCQLGITICSVGLGFVAEPALAAVIDPALRTAGIVGAVEGAGHTGLSVALSLGVINLLHVTVGEQAPTYLGIERTKLVAKYGAPILYLWTTTLSPVIRAADWFAKFLLGLFGVTITRSWAEEELEEGEEPDVGATRAETLSQMGDVLSGLNLSRERREEVISALAIDRITVEDVMIDREDVVAVSTANSVEENFDVMHGTPHTRYPLVGEDLDEIEGTVYVPALLDRDDELESGETTFAEVAAPAMTVEPGLAISEVIDRFQEADQELALIVDEGRTVGLVTATDAIEVITGDLRDPLDEEESERR